MLLVKHKVSAVDDEQKLRCEGHITQMEETKPKKINTIHTFRKDLSKDVTNFQEGIANMKRSYVGVYPTRCIVVNNLKPYGDDYRCTV